MAAVRRGTCDETGKLIDRSKLRPPTDVMAITSLPKAWRQGFSIQSSILPSAIDSAICSGRFAALLSRRHEFGVELEEGLRAVGVEKGEALDELRIMPRNDVGLEGQAGFAEAAGAAMREFLREV